MPQFKSLKYHQFPLKLHELILHIKFKINLLFRKSFLYSQENSETPSASRSIFLRPRRPKVSWKKSWKCNFANAGGICAGCTENEDWQIISQVNTKKWWLLQLNLSLQLLTFFMRLAKVALRISKLLIPASKVVIKNVELHHKQCSGSPTLFSTMSSGT